MLLEEIVYDETGDSARRRVTGDCLDEQITVQSVNEGVRQGRHRCRPRNVANECDLSEPVAPADLAQVAALARHFEYAVCDCVVLISGIALADDTRPGRDVYRLEFSGHDFERWSR